MFTFEAGGITFSSEYGLFTSQMCANVISQGAPRLLARISMHNLSKEIKINSSSTFVRINYNIYLMRFGVDKHV